MTQKAVPKNPHAILRSIGPIERAAQRAVREALAADLRPKPATTRKASKKKTKRR